MYSFMSHVCLYKLYVSYQITYYGDRLKNILYYFEITGIGGLAGYKVVKCLERNKEKLQLNFIFNKYL